MRREHAEHNEELSDFLLTTSNYNDWVVTTAFYSAIHFLEYKIFPTKIDGRDYNTFNEYYEEEIKTKNLSKHKLKAKIVQNRLPGINAQYRWLMDACMNARYTNYIVSDPKAKSANDILKIIKSNCI